MKQKTSRFFDSLAKFTKKILSLHCIFENKIQPFSFYPFWYFSLNIDTIFDYVLKNLQYKTTILTNLTFYEKNSFSFACNGICNAILGTINLCRCQWNHNQFVLPVYGTWMDANQHDQFIYPATEVAPLT